MSISGVKNPFNIVVIVAALGYFVDIYDLILFGIVKDPSLRAIGVSEEALFSEGQFLLNMQMIGMLIGGIVWGILGDKKGRLSTLFFTILMYSIANIANGFVQNMTQYAWLRFIAGFGLAGELGIGITLVAEVMTKESRGYGASVVSGIGIIGAVLAFMVNDMFDWRMAYWVGGVLGLLLLFMRVAVHESGMYHKTKEENISKGNFLSLFTNAKRFKKYFFSILIGVPVWYTISVLVINSAAFATQLNIQGTVKGSTAVMLHYVGASIGSLLYGYLAQRWQSRKKSVMAAILSIAVLIVMYFVFKGASSIVFYSILFLIGVPMGGLWAVFVTASSEQFGTNLRATVATSAPNFVRGSTVLISLFIIPGEGLLVSGFITGIVCCLVAIGSCFLIEETYGKDLDYTE